MNALESQLRDVPPSAKEPLFRRLMTVEELSYLREQNGIIGFEVDTEADQELSGFTLVALQKHTIYAYCADLDEPARLVLFPPLDKLFDDAFSLLDLKVTKKLFLNSTFQGRTIESGIMGELVKALTPPAKEVDIPVSVANVMAEHMKHAREADAVVYKDEAQEEVKVAATKTVPVTEEEAFYEEPPMDDEFAEGYEDEFDESGYDAYGESGFEYESDFGYEEEPAEEETVQEPVEDERSSMIKAQTFESLAAVGDFAYGKLGVARALATNVVNKALQSNVDPEFRIALAVKLFCKLFDEKKI